MWPSDVGVKEGQARLLIVFSALLLMLASTGDRVLSVRVPPSPLLLTYHKGPLMAGPISLRVVFYGRFSAVERETLRAFLYSLSPHNENGESPMAKGTTPSSSNGENPAAQEAPGNNGENPIAQEAQGAPSSSNAENPVAQEAYGSPSRSNGENPIAQVAQGGPSSSDGENQEAQGGPSSSNGENPIAQEAHGAHPRSLLTTPLVSRWWSLTSLYKNAQGAGVSPLVSLAREASIHSYPKGRSLTASHISAIVEEDYNSSRHHRHPGLPLYVVFTAHDVRVEGFCMHACGQHSFVELDGGEKRLPYAWIGNPKSQCLGFCAWPFARAGMGPPSQPLRPPHEAAVDGMIITLAKLLVGAGTDPLGNAYHQGESALEGGSACAGAFGTGAYPGFPGHLLEDPLTHASYNMVGWKSHKFLVPWTWNPRTLACAGQA